MNTSSTTGPQARIQNDLKEAMKSGQKERLGTLRMLLTEIKNEAIRVGEEVDEDRFVALVKKAIKQRKDSAEQFRKGGREEMAAKEDREAEVLSAYLPAQAGEAEIRAAIEGLVAEEGLAGPAAIGQVMKAMLAHFGSSADGGTINRIAREVLTGPR
ncbi:MAG: GatB/YqeY domain-containing protein [Acidobacteria bacterium]|nr:GatB/YqeY domain-containing protein [Acidobacteriota bacterium]